MKNKRVEIRADEWLVRCLERLMLYYKQNKSEVMRKLIIEECKRINKKECDINDDYM